MLRLIEKNRDALTRLCRDFGVQRLEVFGSVVTDRFEPGRSDVDFLVEFPPGYDFGPWLARLQEFQESLERLIGCSVDLVMPRAIRNPYFRREVEKTRTVLYDAS